METKKWWRPTDTMYNFIMQCAKTNENGAKPYSMEGKLADADVSASFHANSRNFANGRLWEIDFSLNSWQMPRNLERLVVDGVKEFGGSRIVLGSAEKKCGVEIYETISVVKKAAFGLLWKYSVTTKRLNPPYTGRKTKIRLSNKIDMKKAAEAMQGMMEREERAQIYADKGTDSQVIIDVNNNGNARPYGIFMRKSRAERFSDLLTADDICKFDEIAAHTGYHFKGKEWEIKLMYGEGK